MCDVCLSGSQLGEIYDEGVKLDLQDFFVTQNLALFLHLPVFANPYPKCYVHKRWLFPIPNAEVFFSLIQSSIYYD